MCVVFSSVDECVWVYVRLLLLVGVLFQNYEGWNFNSGNYLFTTDTK